MQLQHVVEEIKNANSILLLTHNSPDGDALGSMFAMYYCLKDIGKEVFTVLQQNVPDVFCDLVPLVYRNLPTKNYDLIIILDCSTKERTYIDVCKNAYKTIIIDHHINIIPNIKYDHLLLQNTNATAVIIYDVIKQLTPITKEIASMLYLGIKTDTVNFTIKQMQSRTFEVLSDLVHYDIDINKINTIQCYSYNAFMLLNKALHRTKIDNEYHIAYTVIREKDIISCHAHHSDTKIAIEYISNIRNIDVYLLLVEYKDFVRVSARSKCFNVNKLLKHFGGGGHDNASGCKIRGNIYEIVKDIINKYKDILNGGGENEKITKQS